MKTPVELRERTKSMFAREFTTMLGEMPFNKIRVSELCERCGVATRLFYYHFKDKDELAGWVFFSHYMASYSANGPIESKDDWEKATEVQLERLWQNRDFYRKLLMDCSSSSLSNYIASFSEEVNISCLKKHLKTDKLDEKHLFMASFVAYGETNVFVKWILGNYQVTAKQLASLLIDATPPLLIEAYFTGAYIPNRYEKGAVF